MGCTVSYAAFFELGLRDPQRWEEIFPRLSADAAFLIAASGVAIAGPDGEGEPIINEKFIALNGSEDDGGAHESFILSKRASKNGGFCKTDRKSYDVVVMAILIRATQLLGKEYMDGGGKGEIASDGNWKSKEWGWGRQLVRSVFPDEVIECPWDS